MMLLRSKRFFTTKTVRRKVEAILHRFGLTAANIDAEALRCSLADIAEINRRLTELVRAATKFCSGLRMTVPASQGLPTCSNAAMQMNRRVGIGEPTADRCQP